MNGGFDGVFEIGAVWGDGWAERGEDRFGAFARGGSDEIGLPGLWVGGGWGRIGVGVGRGIVGLRGVGGGSVRGHVGLRGVLVGLGDTGVGVVGGSWGGVERGNFKRESGGDGEKGKGE